MRRRKTPSNKKLAASVLKPILSREHVLSSLLKNILFPNKSTRKSASLYIGPQTLVERTSPEHFSQSHANLFFCSKSGQGSPQTKTFEILCKP
jgi:hypothetical protein